MIQEKTDVEILKVVEKIQSEIDLIIEKNKKEPSSLLCSFVQSMIWIIGCSEKPVECYYSVIKALNTSFVEVLKFKENEKQKGNNGN